jgi:hypothetical protein
VCPEQLDSTLNSGVRGNLKLSILACGGFESHSVKYVGLWRVRVTFRVWIRPLLFCTMGKYGRLDAFARGQILGLRQGGAGRLEITRLVKKKDGKHPTVRTVDNILSTKEADPSWHGEDSRAGGRPAALPKSDVGALTRLVFRERGKAVVTAPYCMKRLPFLQLLRV